MKFLFGNMLKIKALVVSLLLLNAMSVSASSWGDSIKDLVPNGVTLKFHGGPVLYFEHGDDIAETEMATDDVISVTFDYTFNPFISENWGYVIVNEFFTLKAELYDQVVSDTDEDVWKSDEHEASVDLTVISTSINFGWQKISGNHYALVVAGPTIAYVNASGQYFDAINSAGEPVDGDISQWSLVNYNESGIKLGYAITALYRYKWFEVGLSGQAFEFDHSYLETEGSIHFGLYYQL